MKKKKQIKLKTEKEEKMENKHFYHFNDLLRPCNTMSCCDCPFVFN